MSKLKLVYMRARTPSTIAMIKGAKLNYLHALGGVDCTDLGLELGFRNKTAEKDQPLASVLCRT